MAYSAVKIQISPESVPSTPSWFGEVAVVAQILISSGLLHRIETKVQLARARFGHYDLIDFVAVLIGYSLSGEPTLQAFYTRLEPFAGIFMALFHRHHLPHRSTLSRFLASLDQSSVDALRAVFQEDLLARTPFGPLPGGVWDRLGQRWLIIDIDGTRQAARQRALPHTPDLPEPHRRFDQVCAKGYLGRKRGEVGRTRTTVLQPYTHQWLGTFSGPGNGAYREELTQALHVVVDYATAFSIPLSHVVIRLDGLYGNTAPIRDLFSFQLGALGRSRQYSWLDLPEVQARLRLPPDEQVIHPESGALRNLYDCPTVALTPQGPVVRLVVATHPAPPHPISVGTVRKDTVYELFYTFLPPQAFLASDVLNLYLHRGSFEPVLSDEDDEQDPDRWVSRCPCGQECWQILSQWMWNLRLELGHHMAPTDMRQTEFAAAFLTPETPPTLSPPLSSAEPTQAGSLIYGPPQWLTTPEAGEFSGSDFTPLPNGMLCCPAGQHLSLKERRREPNGSLRLLYSARRDQCLPCPLREHCQEATAKRPRTVSAMLWPLSMRFAPPGPLPVLWGDWERRSLRRQWIQVLRSQTVIIEEGVVHARDDMEHHAPQTYTRAQRAHWRLSWDERFARNARPTSAPPLTITIHGLPASFARFFGIAVVATA
jgi:hypothetical protein